MVTLINWDNYKGFVKWGQGVRTCRGHFDFGDTRFTIKKYIFPNSLENFVINQKCGQIKYPTGLCYTRYTGYCKNISFIGEIEKITGDRQNIQKYIPSVKLYMTKEINDAHVEQLNADLNANLNWLKQIVNLKSPEIARYMTKNEYLNKMMINNNKFILLPDHPLYFPQAKCGEGELYEFFKLMEREKLKDRMAKAIETHKNKVGWETVSIKKKVKQSDINKVKQMSQLQLCLDFVQQSEFIIFMKDYKKYQSIYDLTNKDIDWLKHMKTEIDKWFKQFNLPMEEYVKYLYIYTITPHGHYPILTWHVRYFDLSKENPNIRILDRTRHVSLDEIINMLEKNDNLNNFISTFYTKINSPLFKAAKTETFNEHINRYNKKVTTETKIFNDHINRYNKKVTTENIDCFKKILSTDCSESNYSLFDSSNNTNDTNVYVPPHRRNKKFKDNIEIIDKNFIDPTKQYMQQCTNSLICKLDNEEYLINFTNIDALKIDNINAKKFLESIIVNETIETGDKTYIIGELLKSYYWIDILRLDNDKSKYNDIFFHKELIKRWKVRNETKFMETKEFYEQNMLEKYKKVALNNDTMNVWNYINYKYSEKPEKLGNLIVLKDYIYVGTKDLPYIAVPSLHLITEIRNNKDKTIINNHNFDYNIWYTDENSYNVNKNNNSGLIYKNNDNYIHTIRELNEENILKLYKFVELFEIHIKDNYGITSLLFKYFHYPVGIPHSTLHLHIRSKLKYTKPKQFSGSFFDELENSKSYDIDKIYSNILRNQNDEYLQSLIWNQ